MKPGDEPGGGQPGWAVVGQSLPDVRAADAREKPARPRRRTVVTAGGDRRPCLASPYITTAPDHTTANNLEGLHQGAKGIPARHALPRPRGQTFV